MGFLGLFAAASMPVLKVLLVTAVGSFLALDRIDLLGESTRKQVNTIVFYVFSPPLVGGNLAQTITMDTIISLWFMPINILLTFIIGSALGWILMKIIKTPQHLKGLILGSCSAGNLGNLLLIIVPAICKEKASPFGDPDICHDVGMGYASLSMAIGAVYLWLYVYNLVRVYSSQTEEFVNIEDSIITIKSATETSVPQKDNLTERLLPSKEYSSIDNAHGLASDSVSLKEKVKVISDKIKQHLGNISRHLNLKAIFAPSTIGAIVGFAIGTITPVRKLMIGSAAPLHVIQDSASLLGDAAIPTMTIILGGNLLRGLKGSGIKFSLIFGIVAVRYIFLPIIGIFIVKGAIYLGLVNSDPLYQFILLLQFALPPAMNIGTITQLFGAGESECSVIMLWAYCLASVSLTLWSTLFMSLVA